MEKNKFYGLARRKQVPFVDPHSSNSVDSAWIDGQMDRADAAPSQLRHIPRFQYDPPKAARNSYGAITADRSVFHQIDDMDAFYAAMGYDESARASGMSGEEFVWERYTRDGAKMSKDCLQIQISAYLHKHSPKFEQLYGLAYAAMLAGCESSDIDKTDQHCANCPLYPPPAA